MLGRFTHRGDAVAPAPPFRATGIGALMRSFARSLGAGLAVLAVAAATVVLAPGAAYAAGTITIATFSVPIENRNSGACPLMVPTSTVILVDTNPCFETQFISNLSQTSVPPASIPGYQYHQLAISPVGVLMFVGDPAVGCLDVPNRSSGTQVIVSPCSNVTVGEFWTVVQRNGGFIYANLASGKCLAQGGTDPLTGAGEVIQTNCDQPSAIWNNSV